jgi:alpha-L-arabinofuranosidase
VLRAQIDSPTYAATYFDPRGAQDLFFSLPEVPYLKLAAVHDEQHAMLTLFALNRSLDEQMQLRVDVHGFSELKMTDALELHDTELSAANTRELPERVMPSRLETVRVDGGVVEATLKPASWNVIRLQAA